MPPMVAPQTAKAAARALPTNTALMMDSDAGSMSAPPRPWSARAPMISTALPDKATRTLAETKTIAPITKMSRRPSRSASRPATMSKEAKTSE